MSGVAGAIIGAAVVGAGAAIYSANKAAGATESASQAAITEQRSALQQQKDLTQPYRDAGTGAIGQLESLLGISPGGGPVDNTKQLDTLKNTPGYQFALKEGLAATKNASTTSGTGPMSGNTLEALTKYASGLAQGTYGTEVSQLQNLVNTGANAATGTASNVGQAATNIGNIGINQGTNQANLTLGTVGNITGTLNNAANQYTLQQTLGNINRSSAGMPDLSTSGFPTLNSGLPTETPAFTPS